MRGGPWRLNLQLLLLLLSVCCGYVHSGKYACSCAGLVLTNLLLLLCLL
jgi:hypothetical protein